MTIKYPPEHERSTGAKPFGLSEEATADEAADAHAVQAMFDTIMPT